MKKKEAIRTFNFSDAVLVIKGREKIAFMKRDAAEFANFDIKTTDVAQLETSLTAFSESITDIEALSDQTEVTAIKDVKAEELRVAIRDLMTRVELKFGLSTARYKKFGTETLSKQSDADLLITGKRVVRVAKTLLSELAPKGVTPAMLAAITTLYSDFEELLITMKIKIGDRDVLQEDRVEEANRIYATLVSYTNTGRNIWSTSNVAKYNDYVIYNTISGEAPVDEPVI
jgi:hypothetical protein